MFKDKVTVIIQGPVHPNSLIATRSLSTNFTVIVSTWKYDRRDEKNLDNLVENGDHVTIVSHNIESLKPKLNDGNRYYQYYSTLKGAMLTSTEFIIKMRSDEYYTDLRPFAEKMLNSQIRW